MKAALIRNGIVENVIVPGDDWVCPPEYTMVTLEDHMPVGPGYFYVNGEFARPVSLDPPPPPNHLSPFSMTKMSKFQFRKRFTMEELLKFDNPELYLPNLTVEQKALVNTLKSSFEAATEIDLTDDVLKYGMNLMVQWGLLTEERKNQILDPNWKPNNQ